VEGSVWVSQRVAVLLLAGMSVAGLPVAGQQTPPRIAQFLRQSIGLDSTQLSEVESGKAVVKVLDTQDNRDVAVFGIITIGRPRAAYIARVQDVANWLRAPDRKQFALFMNPPTAADVQAVTIDSQDVSDLQKCKPNDCHLKLPASEVQRVQQEIDWSAPDRGAHVNAYARQRMVEYATTYGTRGDSALVVYDDRGTSVRASDTFDRLLAQSPYLFHYSPEFHKYLSDYPHATLGGVSDVLFWSKDALPHLRPILSITHLSVYTPPDPGGMTLVAAKQLYADHYFEGEFDLMAVVDRPTPTGQGTCLIAIRRFRFDNLPSGGLLNLRGKAVGGLRDRMRSDLEHEKAATEKGT
jgi:hypothetical protein